MKKIGILSRAAKIAKSGLDFGVGGLKSIIDVPRETAALGNKLGASASKAVTKILSPKKSLEKPKENFLDKGIKGTDFSRPTTSSERAGFAAGEIAQLVTPAGEEKGALLGAKIAEKLGTSEKLALWASKLGKLSLNSLAQGAIATNQSGSLKEGAATAGANLIGAPVLHVAGKVAGSIAKTLASGFSDVPVAAIEKMFRDPKQVEGAISEALKQGEGAEGSVLEKARGALDELKNIRRDSYEQNLKKIANETFTNGEGQLFVKDTATGESKPVDITLQGVKKNITQTLNNFRVNLEKKLVDTSSSKLPSGYQKDIQELVNEAYNWKDMSPLGMDTLVSRLKNLAKEGQTTGDKQFNSILKKVTSNLDSYVNERLPQVADLRRTYAQQSDVIDTIQEELFSKKDSTSTKKLLNIFNPKNELHRKLVKELGDKSAQDLLADISGVLFSKAAPEGMGKRLLTLLTGTGVGYAAAANPAALLALPGVAAASSPRVVGEVTRGLSTVKPLVKPLEKAAAGLAGKAIRYNSDVKQEQNKAQEMQSTSATDTLDTQYSQFKKQIEAARKAGYSDEQTLQFIQENIDQLQLSQ